DDQNYLAVGVDSNLITNQGTTLYDIVTSDAFSILTRFINDDDELKETLSDEDAALTFFAPIDKALECLKDKKIPKEVIRLNSSGLNDTPQKVRVSGWIRSTYINWSKIKIYHLAAGNGHAYGIDHVLIPPPDIMTELFIIPTFFSTLTSALQKVGLAETLETSKAITVFIPSNRAWAKLGFRNLAYLFSPHGKDVLTTILKYHISPELAYSTDLIEDKELFGGIPGKRHTELDTLVKITVNGVRVLFKDFIANNGVGHTIARVLLPPTTNLYLPDDDYQTIKDGSELMAEIDVNEENEKLLELKRKSEKHESKTEHDVTRGPV
ncbi:2491_t:CDS:2, partial [Paraglomus brasilianum]